MRNFILFSVRIRVESRDIETDSGPSPRSDGWPSPLFLSVLLSAFPNTPVFHSRTYLHQSSFLFLFYVLSCSSSLPTVKNLYTFFAGPNGQVQQGVRRAVCFLLDESCCSSVSPSVPPPPSSGRSLPRHFLRRTFAGVFPLSSRKKFFYNFWIVLFRPSRFFQPRAGRSPLESVSSLHHQPPFLQPPTSVCVFLFSRFHLVQPFLCYLAVFLRRSRQHFCFLFFANCTRSADWRNLN